MKYLKLFFLILIFLIPRYLASGTIFSDDFNRASSATTLGPPWVAIDGTWGIEGNATAYLASAPNGHNVAYVDVSISSYTVACDWSSVGASICLSWRNKAGSTNRYEALSNGNNKIYIVIRPENTTLGTYNWNAMAGDRIKVIVNGFNFKAYVNESFIGECTDSGSLYSGNYVGIATESAVRGWDNFAVTTDDSPTFTVTATQTMTKTHTQTPTQTPTRTQTATQTMTSTPGCSSYENFEPAGGGMQHWSVGFGIGGSMKYVTTTASHSGDYGGWMILNTGTEWSEAYSHTSQEANPGDALSAHYWNIVAGDYVSMYVTAPLGKNFKVRIREATMNGGDGELYLSPAWSTGTGSWQLVYLPLSNFVCSYLCNDNILSHQAINAVGLFFDGNQGAFDAYIDDINFCVASSTATPTVTGSVTDTSTQTPTYTPTQTATYTGTQTFTPTYTETNTPSYTGTETPTYTGTETPTYTGTRTETYSPTGTSTETPTYTGTETPTYTETETATYSPTNTSTKTHTYTGTETETHTSTETPTYTNTETPSYTSTETQTATYSGTRTFTRTETNSPTQTPTQTQTHTSTITQTFTPVSCGEIITDSFNRADSPTLGVADTGQWWGYSYVGNIASIKSGMAYDGPGLMESSDPNGYVSMRFTDNGTLWFRGDSTLSNGWFVQVQGSVSPLIRLANSNSMIDWYADIDYVPNSILRVDYNGDSIVVSYNGEQKINIVDSFSNDRTFVGFYLGTDEYVDDFEAVAHSGCSPTHTQTETPTRTATFTKTRTQTPTETHTQTYTQTYTQTETMTFTTTHTYTETETKTASYTETNTGTITNTGTKTPTQTTTRTNTCSPTRTLTGTRTFTMTKTATRTTTHTGTVTRTGTITPTGSVTKTRTITPTFITPFTKTPVSLFSPTQTLTKSITPTLVPARTRTPTKTPTPPQD